MDGTILGDASESLRRMLEAAVRLVFPTASVTLDSPRDAVPGGPDQAVISLWLYRVTRHGDLVNLPPRRVALDRVERSRLPLQLHYLMTPLGADMLTRQRLLGVAMQAMHDRALVPAGMLEAPLLAAGVGGLHVHLETHGLEELTRVWHALTHPYELSSCYLVDFVPLPSGQETVGVAPVIDKRATYMEAAPVTAEVG
jgi:hypothetical protein